MAKIVATSASSMCKLMCRSNVTSKIRITFSSVRFECGTSDMSTKDDSVENLPSIMALTDQLATTMGIERGYRPIPKSREHLQKLIQKDRSKLPHRTMRDSYTVAAIPLAANPALQEVMVGITGQVRLSMLLEDMDIFAVIVAQNYIYNPLVSPGDPSPYTIVTAQANRIYFSDFTPRINGDIRISGHVSWVGQSSVEVIVWLDQELHNSYQRITRAVFLLAIRDAVNASPAVINPLKATSDEEQAVIKAGDNRKNHRVRLKNQILTKTLPSLEEQKIIHDMFQRTISKADVSLVRRKLPPGCLWMSECQLSNIVHSQPLNRNLHNTVFGGFLMRQAADLGTSLAWMFAKQRPTLKTISDINFTKPVSISSMLRMNAHVVYTELNFIQITVYAETYDYFQNENTTTNSFHLTYETTEVVKEVFPRTYNEAMMFIDGRRHFHQVVDKADNVFDFEHLNFGDRSKL